MAHLIDRDALAAEIKRFRKNNEPKENMQYAQFALDVACGYDMALDDIEAFIDTLEVKEVDLEKEIKNEINKYYDNCEKHLSEMADDDTDFSFLTLNDFAKHFFELGLKNENYEIH